ncbi:uncharacterized protein N7515_003631 [Penicillium bovifimosum]|uniref:WD40 repeat-like protein n=1 Tax=Penicillium bovifimosum TaxID=126998 RepID=A0A9W9H570_9EURO|nr:uncharacterized protein N7515_003631 [Penicillium bovifimosum]KAJ5138783.1 hypothetical protein N7515_003631 [Penicillium bovifimosum]
MVDMQRHSFEEAPPTGNRKHAWESHSRSQSSEERRPVLLTEFATISLPFFETTTTSQSSLSDEPGVQDTLTPAPHCKENRTLQPQRGRKRVRRATSPVGLRSSFRSPISPDRFIPKRDFEPTSTAFHITKHPQRLSPQEKSLRRLPPGDDPFLPTTPSRGLTVGPQQPIRLRQIPHHRPRQITELIIAGSHSAHGSLRQVSSGAVWNVSGTSAVLGSSPVTTANDPRITSSNRSPAPVYVARFLPKKPKYSEDEIHESRLALALGIDPTTRQLETCLRYLHAPTNPASPDYAHFSPFFLKESDWKTDWKDCLSTSLPKKEVVPANPFRILDAPFLRDDFYCSTLAYSTTSGILAVGLGHKVYLWSEGRGLSSPPFPRLRRSNYVTSLAFSSENGERSILAVTRRSGQLTLWSTFEKHVRYEISHPCTLTSVAFKPTTSRRPSERFGYFDVDVEELVVGDELGNIWYYSVEWTNEEDQAKWKWNGSMTLIAKICAHTQQICGLAWSPDEKYLASGGNDNACLLFDLAEVIPRRSDSRVSSVPSPDTPSSYSLGAFPYFALGSATRRMFSRRPALNHIIPSWVTPAIKPSSTTQVMNHAGTLIAGDGRTILVPFDSHKHRLVHSAAVKAIAFAPWQPSLLATGGGTNDRAIHFYHTRSGACLATINVFAQVTSLIWSETQREIVATFGYAQPEHPFRIAVFAWPSCAQVAAIPWGPYGSSWDGSGIQPGFDCGRALWAVRYPGKLPKSFGVPFGSQSSSRIGSPGYAQSSEQRGSTGRRKSGPRTVTPKEKEGGMWCARTKEEGCIIVASSDQSIKFHEVWGGRKTSMSPGCGLFGGSDILEGLEGIEKSSGEVIR